LPQTLLEARSAGARVAQAPHFAALGLQNARAMSLRQALANTRRPLAANSTIGVE
jgi:hypothetical protein